ncbi:O-antigen ligase [Bradyrhizobium japonicum]|uniref:O-antigen ligase family protein n=1 Tax=Bradyrhizobium TaxID=374 RepID=UPI0003F5D547|nr:MULTISPECIES: O-antigen ligase [Bradyrhizobium]MBR0877055.1 O-antigen ligase family protein [Bradyrhizobium liaoningense]MBR0997289.1 O-antigen ligase family protein [Bradyrhizobium liaoningense]MBR1063057.1 O-antigen ligase family protein [Bradyrhizobium liaoningense]MCP1745619.1 O-antigen ligase [Bradyrhizobium japonicum]MCP1775532.1 O-antigen ligase [Bradyrhizobium japonicum]
MDRRAADMTDVETRTLGHMLHDGLAGLNAAQAARCLVAVAALLLVLITLDPFPDLRNEDVTTVVGGRMALTYISWGLLAAVAMLFVAATDAPALKSLVTPLHLCLVGWLLINIVFSESRGVSIQRFVLAVSVTSLAMLLPLLPPTQRTFNLCLGGAALALLVLCYLGVFLAPQYSMHTALDLTEPQLAGDWRGSFGHKNIASPVMTILVYVGIYLCGVGSFVMGPAIAALAGIFLIFTGGKTSTVLCLAIYALASLVYVTPGLWLKRLICFVPLIVMNLLTVGSVLSPALGALTRLLPLDPTFTGRSAIWEFALAAVAEKPIIGHGYAAFWDDVTARQTAQGSEWATSAAHSHNSYLDLAVTIGLPGLVLVILVFVFAPLGNFQSAQAHNRSRALAKLFLTIWLFGLYYGATETFLLERQNPIWFMFALAVAGLHFLARFQCVEQTEPER